MPYRNLLSHLLRIQFENTAMFDQEFFTHNCYLICAFNQKTGDRVRCIVEL